MIKEIEQAQRQLSPLTAHNRELKQQDAVMRRQLVIHEISVKHDSI